MEKTLVEKIKEFGCPAELDQYFKTFCPSYWEKQRSSGSILALEQCGHIFFMIRAWEGSVPYYDGIALESFNTKTGHYQCERIYTEDSLHEGGLGCKLEELTSTKLTAELKDECYNIRFEFQCRQGDGLYENHADYGGLWIFF